MPTARITDPDTSHEAGRSISAEDMSETQKAIIKILQTKDLTDEQIFQIYFQGAEHGYWKHASMSGVRSRRAELVRAGIVEKKDRSKSNFGRACYVWGLK